MVREALDAAYQKKDPLERRKETALSAYREGFISLGKVAEILGLDPVSARAYPREAGVLLKSRTRPKRAVTRTVPEIVFDWYRLKLRLGRSDGRSRGAL